MLNFNLNGFKKIKTSKLNFLLFFNQVPYFQKIFQYFLNLFPSDLSVLFKQKFASFSSLYFSLFYYKIINWNKNLSGICFLHAKLLTTMKISFKKQNFCSLMIFKCKNSTHYNTNILFIKIYYVCISTFILCL